MTRLASAAAIAAALASFAAFDAAAAPVTGTLFSRPLACAVDKMDGQALKVRILVTNTTGRYIKRGTPITLTIQVRLANPRAVKTVTQKLAAYQDLAPRATIGFDQPSGAMSCTARVATSIDKTRLSAKPRLATH